MATDSLSAIFHALSDPTRRGLLARLAHGEASVTELAQPYDMSVAAISKHLKVLEGAGLVSRGRAAQWRPARLEAAPMQEAATFIEAYRHFWDTNLDRLGSYLDHLQQADPQKH